METKNYEIGAKLYTQMYEEFIERYFGENKAINEYAKKLIFLKEKKALAELNKVVRILGINKSFEKTEEVIFKIEKRFNLGSFAQREKDDGSSSDISNVLSFVIIAAFIILVLSWILQ